MTIQQTKDIILSWLSSCTSFEQCHVLEDAINNYWMKRFEEKEGLVEVEIVKLELGEAIEKKMREIQILNSMPTAPTLERNQRDI